MKTIKYTLAKFMVAAIVAVVLVGCKKENEPQNNNNGNPTEVAQQQNGDAVKRLLEFRKQVKRHKDNPFEKSGETLTLSEAIWDIENNFNATYTKPEDYYTATAEHFFSIYLPVSATGTVLLDDVLDMYEQAKSAAREAYSNDGFTNKGFISLTAKLGQDYGDQVRIDFFGRTGERTAHPNLPPHDTAMYLGPFSYNNEDHDNWHFQAPNGRYGNPNCGSGADEQLNEKLDEYMIAHRVSPENGERSIYLDRLEIIFDGTYPSYPVFFRPNPNDVYINFNQMNMYYQRERRAIFETIPALYPGYEPFQIKIKGDAPFEPYTLGITHRNEIQYGRRMQVSISEFGEVEDLLN